MTLSPCKDAPGLAPCPTLLLLSCAPEVDPSPDLEMLERTDLNDEVPTGFAVADGSRPLTFPEDFGAHPDFRTEWWYYTGNLDTRMDGTLASN
jgi:predicted secreted hydrolase